MTVPPKSPTDATPSSLLSPSSPSSPLFADRAPARVTRRGLIGAAGALAAGAVFAPAATADPTPPPAAAGTTSEAFPETRVKAATGEGSVQADFPIGYVGVRWSGTRGATGGGIRLIGANGAEGPWRPLTGTGCSDGDGGTLLIPADGASGYELRAPDGATDLRSLAIDTTHGPMREVAVPTDTTRVRGVAYLTRAAWGADEKLRFRSDGTEISPQTYHPFQTLTVHHTATANGDPDPAATVRALYHVHTVTNDWGDIGYHYLIDEAGQIYEGRYSGEGATPAHDDNGKLVTGFHVLSFNPGNLGIALIGNLVKQGPTAAARTALTDLVRSVVRMHGVDPEARVEYVSPTTGRTKEVHEIGGHRDWMATECPGEAMYGELAALRKAAASGG
ncbi:hypothetical protein QFZ75_005770 [Streptomyces sp. V3I8]|uniref:peptidoglycan recognition protein family protein n=1 Tax=Streptomyces sp. V3I8 TaxID=3042279 RepID=UPI002786ABDB|nr:peptidoglycan recognition family protein [Streptomyces sp. V3I8]MDQ1039354.1 hypothetical protein [Streptomyces sp. V3I8]